jgi:dTDP-4-dehydrorhamnose 3,5-epimerase
MDFVALDLPGLLEIVPSRFADERGYFSETFRDDRFRAHAGEQHFVQDNQSLSSRAGTLRGLHFQSPPSAQGKLVRCIAGALFDVAVDLRHGSPCYGKWAGATLSSEAGNQLWIPPGFAHGFCTLAPDTIISYKVTAYYSPGDDHGLAWDDPDIAIAWPAVAAPETLSGKDAAQPAFRTLPHYFPFED